MLIALGYGYPIVGDVDIGDVDIGGVDIAYLESEVYENGAVDTLA